VADNIVTRGALNKGLDAVGTRVMCIPIDDGAALTRKGVSCFTHTRVRAR